MAVRRHRELALLLFSTALSLAAVEVALRALYGAPPRFLYPQESYVADADVGHWPKPGQRAFSHDAVVTTNRLGLRDRDLPARVPAGVRRILAIGDSQTYGEGLALEDTWPKQLEAALRAEDPSARWEVVNAGISGTDTWQHERVLRRLLEAYEAHGVALAFYVNDVAPIYVPAAPEGLTNTASKRVGYVLKRSALFSLVWARVRAANGVGDAERRILRGEPSPRIEEGWAQVERSLRAMKAMCDARSIPLVLAVLPRRDQVDGSEPGSAYNRRVREAAERVGVPAVDLLEPLRAAWAEHGRALFIPWDGHNAGLANAVVARALVAPIRAWREPPARRPAAAR